MATTTHGVSVVESEILGLLTNGGGLVGLVGMLWLMALKAGKWAAPLAEAYIKAHIEMTEQVVSTQKEMLTLMSTIDGRLAVLENNNR